MPSIPSGEQYSAVSSYFNRSVEAKVETGRFHDNLRLATDKAVQESANVFKNGEELFLTMALTPSYINSGV